MHTRVYPPRPSPVPVTYDRNRRPVPSGGRQFREATAGALPRSSDRHVGGAGAYPLLRRTTFKVVPGETWPAAQKVRKQPAAGSTSTPSPLNGSQGSVSLGGEGPEPSPAAAWKPTASAAPKTPKTP